MSEHYIQSQFLIKQISDDFFREKNDVIRIKEIDYQLKEDDVSSIDSEESDLEEEEQEETFHYLDNNKEVLTIFDLCDNEEDILKEYTVHLCCYKLQEDGSTPFLQFLLFNENNDLKFPNFTFKCATNIPNVDTEEELSSKDVFFQNECTKHFLKYAEPLENIDSNPMKEIYKGYVISDTLKDTIFVILDANKFDVQENELACVDEIVNKHSVLEKKISPVVFEMFYQFPSLMQIKNNMGVQINIPRVLYLCTYENEYTNVEGESGNTISILDESVEHPLFGNCYIFSNEALEEEKVVSLKRYAVFLKNSAYIMKNLSNLVEDEEEEGFTLGKVIPSIVEFTQGAPEKQEQEEESEQEEEESEQEEGEESEQQEEESEQEEEESEQEEEESEQEEGEESEQEEVVKEEKLSSNELIDKIKDLLTDDYDSIYFHENQKNQELALWMVQNSNDFIQI